MVKCTDVYIIKNCRHFNNVSITLYVFMSNLVTFDPNTKRENNCKIKSIQESNVPYVGVKVIESNTPSSHNNISKNTYI